MHENWVTLLSRTHSPVLVFVDWEACFFWNLSYTSLWICCFVNFCRKAHSGQNRKSHFRQAHFKTLPHRRSGTAGHIAVIIIVNSENSSVSPKKKTKRTQYLIQNQATKMYCCSTVVVKGVISVSICKVILRHSHIHRCLHVTKILHIKSRSTEWFFLNWTGVNAWVWVVVKSKG